MGAPAPADFKICRRHLPDVCSCCVSRNASVSRNLPINCFFKFLRLNTETRVVYRTKFDIVTFIYKSVSFYYGRMSSLFAFV